MSHLSSDQRPTSSVFAVQRNGILILQASARRRGFAAWVARLFAPGVAAALVTGCGTASRSHGSLLPPGVDLPANHSHDQRPTSLYDQPSLSTADPKSISR